MQSPRDFFSDVDTPQMGKNIEVPQTSGKDFFADIPKKESIGQKIGQSVPIQGALGLASNFTWLGDLYKGWARAEAMQGLEELEEKGIQVDKKKYLEAVESATNLIPTQKMGEDVFKHFTGINLEPEEGTAGAFARGAGEFVNPKGIIKAGAKGIVKKIGSAVAGEAIKEGTEAIGFPKGVSTALGVATSGAINRPKDIKPLSSEAKHLEEISKKHGLRKFSGMFKEDLPLFKPSASGSTIKEAKKSLTETSKKAIQDVVEGKIPIAIAAKKGADIEDIYTKAYETAYSKAAIAKNPVNMKPVIDWIDTKIKSIKEKVPSPSKAQEKVISILEDERKKLTEEVKVPQKMSTKIFDIHGKPVTKEVISKKLAPKKITATQALDQHIAYNENVKGIHKKPELAGMEAAIIDTYAGLNDKFLEAISKSGNNEVVVPFKVANNIFSQNAKMRQSYKILEKGIENPLKLKNILDSKQGNILEKNLGKNAIKDFKEISHYSQKANEKVFDQIKKKPEFIESFKEGKILSYLIGGQAGLGTFLAGEGFQRLQGYLFLKDTSRKAYSNFLKAVSSGSETAIKKYALQLDKAVEEDFGDVDKFLEKI